MGVTKKDRELERVLKALANRRRLAMVRYIRSHRNSSVSQIAEHMDLSLKATSKHLALLGAAGVLEKEQRSVHMHFWLAPDIPDAARKILSLL